MTGIELIAQEREDQLTKHGFSAGFDADFNSMAQLREAVIHLVNNEIDHIKDENVLALCPAKWESHLWLKMCRKPIKERLSIAGALVAAEIDRLQFISA